MYFKKVFHFVAENRFTQKNRNRNWTRAQQSSCWCTAGVAKTNCGTSPHRQSEFCLFVCVQRSQAADATPFKRLPTAPLAILQRENIEKYNVLCLLLSHCLLAVRKGMSERCIERDRYSLRGRVSERWVWRSSSVLQSLRYKHSGSNYFQKGKTITYRTPVLFTVYKYKYTHTSHIRQLVVVVDMPREEYSRGYCVTYKRLSH